MMIAIEGPDGSGKTTVVDRLLRHLGGHGLHVPGCSDSPIGRLVRRGLSGMEPLNALEMQCAYTADRLARAPGLRRDAVPGVNHVCDRWTMSALVYGALHLDHPAEISAHREWLAEINAPVVRPDLYVVLLAPPGVISERLRKRTGIPEIYEREDLLRKISRGYEEVVRTADRWFGGSVAVVDSRGTPDETWEQVLAEVRKNGVAHA
jgi:thymidylate kinase